MTATNQAVTIQIHPEEAPPIMTWEVEAEQNEKWKRSGKIKS